jgi:hypothetical protein
MIYILELKNNKYYVGYSETSDDRRIQKHFIGKGSRWTQIHHPLRLLSTYDGSLEEENDYTLKLMAKCETRQIGGFNSVRGGKWTKTSEYKNPPKELVLFMAGFTTPRHTICTRCKRKGHDVESCLWVTDISGDVIMITESE